MHLARKMLGQRAAKWLRGGGSIDRRDRRALFDRAGGMKLFELQLQLLDLAKDLLALGSEEHALQLLDQQHQALDLAGPRGQGSGVLLMLVDQQCLGGFKIEAVEIRKRGGKHERSMA